MQNIFVHLCIGFSFNLWEGSVNSILSEKEENSKTCITQIEENNQMILFMFWCEVCHQVQATGYQVKEYLKPHQLILHGQMKLCYKFYLFCNGKEGNFTHLVFMKREKKFFKTDLEDDK